MVRPGTTRGPAAVERYLLPREARVATVRKHPAVLIPASALAVAGLLAAAVLTSSVLRGQRGLDELLWLGVAILLANLIWQALNWAVDYFVITSERMILT